MHSDTSDDCVVDPARPLLGTQVRPTSGPPKVVLTFHTFGAEDVELYQVFKEPLQWLDRDLDIFRELRLSRHPANSHKDCYSHNTLDIPALAVVLYLKDCVSHGGINRLQQARQYLQKLPWKLHHSEWVCGNEDNAVQYHVLTLDRPLYSIKAATSERIRIMRYVTHKRWSDSVHFYQLLLSVQPSILKRDFCLFLLNQYTDYEVQFSLKRLPRGIVPKKTRKSEISIAVEDIGGLVALLPHTCYRVNEARWCTRDHDGHKIYLDVKKAVKKRSRSVSPSKLHAHSTFRNLSVFKPAATSPQSQQSEHLNDKLSPGVYNNLRRSQSTIGGIFGKERIQSSSCLEGKTIQQETTEQRNGASWSKLTTYERYITTPVGAVHLSSEADASLDSPDSGFLTGSENVAEGEVFETSLEKKPPKTKSWLEQYIARLSLPKEFKSKRHTSKETLVSDTTSCDEEVDSVINPPAFDHTQYFLNTPLKPLQEAKQSSPFSTIPKQRFTFENSSFPKEMDSSPFRTFQKPEKVPAPSHSVTTFTSFRGVQGRRMTDQAGEGDCSGPEIIVTEDPEPSIEKKSEEKCASETFPCQKEIPQFQLLAKSTELPHKETHVPTTSEETQPLFDSLLKQKGCVKEIDKKLEKEDINNHVVSEGSATTGTADTPERNTQENEQCSTLGQFLQQNKHVSDFLLRLDLGNKDLPDIIRSNTSLHDISEREGEPEDFPETPSLSRGSSGRRVRFSDTLSTHVYETMESDDESTSQQQEVLPTEHLSTPLSPSNPTQLDSYSDQDWQRLKVNPDIGFYI